MKWFMNATNDWMATSKRWALKKEIKSTVAENRVVVYSKTWCPYARDTKSQLTRAGIEFKAIEVDKLDNGNDITDALGELYG